MGITFFLSMTSKTTRSAGIGRNDTDHQKLIEKRILGVDWDNAQEIPPCRQRRQQNGIETDWVLLLG